MKSKKKMLLALGAMSAAAIGAGATSTFAWSYEKQKENAASPRRYVRCGYRRRCHLYIRLEKAPRF